MPVDAALVDEACAVLTVTDPQALTIGGQKAVFTVEQAGVRMVLKVIGIDSLQPDVVRRAEREVELLREIDNPHLVKVKSDLVAVGTPWQGVAWLEELLDGDDLAQVLPTLTDWADVARMAIEVARGLEPMHDRRVVHRDLSPGNVRRRSDGSYVVIDPGYARHELRSDLTIGGQPGTRGYMSPEHLEAYSGVPTAFSDVFSAGILMFQGLCGQVPIAWNGDDADYIRRLSKVQRPPITDFRSDLTAAQIGIVDRCLHPQPARRFANGRALAEALEAIG